MVIGKTYLSCKYREISGEGEGSSGGADEIKALQDQVADLEKQRIAIKKNHDDLLSEKKDMQSKYMKAEKLAAAEALEKATAENNYKELFESSEIKRKELETTIDDQFKSVKSNAKKNKALEIANELSEGVDATLLAKFIVDRLDFVDGEVKVLDSKGHLTISTTEELAKEFKGDVTYASLMKKTSSSGGGANGGTNSGSGAGIDNPWKKETRNLTKQAELIKSDPELAASFKKAAGY